MVRIMGFIRERRIQALRKKYGVYDEWDDYAPVFKWDEQKGLLVVMRSGEELRPEQIHPNYFFWAREERWIDPDGIPSKIDLKGRALMVRVRPLLFMTAPFYTGSYDIDKMTGPQGTRNWLRRMRLGERHGSPPAIFVLQQGHRGRHLDWITVTQYPDGPLLVATRAPPKNSDLFREVCPNPELELDLPVEDE